MARSVAVATALIASAGEWTKKKNNLSSKNIGWYKLLEIFVAN